MPIESVMTGNGPAFVYTCPVKRCGFEGCAETQPWAAWRLYPHYEAHLTRTLTCDRCGRRTKTVDVNGRCRRCDGNYDDIVVAPTEGQTE